MQTDQPAPGTQLGRYQLTELQGQGGFAWVYHARRDDGKSFAIKVLKPRYGLDPAFESRFRQEASLAAGLRHPNIVHIEEVGTAEGMVFFVMDHYPDNLAARSQREPVLAEADVVPIAMGVTVALAFAHDQEVVHRDIKPDNILFAEDGPTGADRFRRGPRGEWLCSSNRIQHDDRHGSLHLAGAGAGSPA